jgi:hypothetical protein
MNRYLLNIGAIFLLLSMFIACARGERPFRMVDVCVGSDAGILELKSDLATVARSWNMKMIDDSEITKRHLEVVGYSGKGRRKEDPVVTVELDREDGMGMGVTNTGLSPHQLALGFSSGRDLAEANRFADDVVARLSAKWTIKDAPKDSGVLYSDTCH